MTLNVMLFKLIQGSSLFCLMPTQSTQMNRQTALAPINLAQQIIANVYYVPHIRIDCQLLQQNSMELQLQ